jgi:hypothetical protein
MRKLVIVILVILVLLVFAAAALPASAQNQNPGEPPGWCVQNPGPGGCASPGLGDGSPQSGGG